MNGTCWTCRVRKKKCDAGKPECFGCRRLGLSCDGYGSKPDWLDGKAAEDEYRHSLKMVVKAGPTRRQCVPGGYLDTRRASVDKPISSWLSPPAYQSQLRIAGAQRGISAQCMPNSFVEQKSAEQGLAVRRTSQSQQTENAESNDESPGTSSSYQGSSSTGDSPTLEHQHSADMDAALVVNEPENTLSSPSNGTDCIELLMDYLDVVFWRRFTFRGKDQAAGGRAWILTLVQDSAAFRWVALSISALYNAIRSGGRGQESVVSQDTFQALANHYHAQALSALRVDIETIRIPDAHDPKRQMTPSVDALVCMVHFVAFDLMNGCRQTIGTHISAGINLLMSLFGPTHLMGIGDTVSCDPAQFRSFSLARRAALSFAASHIVWSDYSLALESRSSPRLPVDPVALFKTLEVDPSVHCGWQPWVFSALYRVSRLDRWKVEQRQEGRLSLTELVLKGNVLCGDILADIERETVLSAALDRNTIVQGQNGRSASSVSIIYGWVAIISLHTVISGARPKLAEIQQGVMKILQCLQKLTPANLHIHAMTAILVAACCADESQRKGFEDVIAESRHHDPLGFDRLSAIIGRCWQQQDHDPSGEWTWAQPSSST